MRIWIAFFTLLTLMLDAGITSAQEPVNQPPPISLLVQKGKQGDNSNVQRYTIRLGETIFIPMGGMDLANQPGSRSQNQNTAPEAYSTANAALSAQLANKITAVQAKQRELDSEIYPAYRAPLGLELQRLQEDLRQLQEKKDKLDARNTVRETAKSEVDRAVKANTPTLPQSVVPGVYVKPTLSDNLVNLEMRSQGLASEAGSTEVQATLKVPLGQWMQVPNQDIWIKLEQVVPQPP